LPRPLSFPASGWRTDLSLLYCCFFHGGSCSQPFFTSLDEPLICTQASAFAFPRRFLFGACVRLLWFSPFLLFFSPSRPPAHSRMPSTIFLPSPSFLPTFCSPWFLNPPMAASDFFTFVWHYLTTLQPGPTAWSPHPLRCYFLFGSKHGAIPSKYFFSLGYFF